MGRFNSIYPFTSENIAGYMKDLDLTSKKVITVTGSTDHILNAILQGATEITTFDINPLTKPYMDLKISALKNLSYEDFIKLLLFESNMNLDYSIISSLDMSDESKMFWLEQLSKYNNSGIELRNSSLFNTKYFNPNSKLWQNLYLEKNKYNLLKQQLKDTNITFINTSIKDLKVDEHFDYMFLSNISDYLSLMYDSDTLKQYRDLLIEFQKKIDIIYFAYLYDIGNSNPRTEIDDLNKVKEIFSNFQQVNFTSALEGSLQEKEEENKMSESRNNSESRGSRYTSTYVSRSSESRDTGESRYSISTNNFSSESRNNSESRCDSRGQVNNTRYNNLDDIDSLIEKLEREMPTITSNNPRINQALEQRRQKIEELKRLRDEARRESEEEKQLRMLEQSNDELDDIIGSVKKLVRKPSKPKNNSTYSSYFSYDYSSESHDSGESRW